MLSTWLVALLVASVLAQDEEMVQIYTPNRYKYRLLTSYGIPAPGMDYIEFRAQACNDVHVALMETPNKLYEIVIGGWSNRKSCFRDRKQGLCLKTFYGKVLDCNNFRDFWVSWQNNKIIVGRGVRNKDGSSVMMEYQSSFPVRVNSIGISTGFGATGMWKFMDFSENDRMSYNPTTLYTPNRYQYQIIESLSVSNRDFFNIKFKVRACNDAHVALMKNPNDRGKLYEIVLGGWRNSKSCFRNRKQGPCLKQKYKRVLDCNHYRDFWISNEDGFTVVGTGKQLFENILMEYEDPNPWKVNYVAVSTGWGAHGRWTFLPLEDN